MRFRVAGGLDLATGALILGGASLVAGSLVAALTLLAPPLSGTPTAELAPAPTVVTRPSAALPPGRVAAVLTVESSGGAGGATRSGDHVDVLAYLPPQVTGADAVT